MCRRFARADKNTYLCSAVGKLHLDLINNKTVFNKGY